MMTDWPEGEMRQTVACNSCGRSETIKVMVPEEWRDDVQRIIETKPQAYWDVIRDWAFQRGWFQLPGGPGEPRTLDVCPTCFTLMRHMAVKGGHG